MYWEELKLFGKRIPFTSDMPPNSVLYSICPLIDFFFSFFIRYKDERVGIPFIHGRSTCTPLFHQGTFLPSSIARNWFSRFTSVLAYLPSTPIDAIFQARRLWYYDYYISFSFFSLVPSLWFHRKVHWHGLSKVVEFHLSSLVFSHTLLHGTMLSRTNSNIFLFQSSRVIQCSPIKFCEMITNFQMQITWCRVKLCTHCIPPPWFEGWLWESRRKAREYHFETSCPTQNTVYRQVHRCKECEDRAVTGLHWCWFMLEVNITEVLLATYLPTIIPWIFVPQARAQTSDNFVQQNAKITK